MPYELVSGVAEKAAGDSVRLPMDFGDIPELFSGATILTTTVTCVVQVGGTGTPPTVSSRQLD